MALLIHEKSGVSGDNISANFLDVIGFSAKFRDFIRIFEKTISATKVLFSCMALLYKRHMAPPPRVEGNSCPIELKSLDYMYVLYFRKGLGTKVSEMMFRRYISNISVCGTDI